MQRDRREAEDFTQMLFHLHQADARALAGYLDLSDRRAVLDAGGVSGVMSIALVSKFPECESRTLAADPHPGGGHPWCRRRRPAASGPSGPRKAQ
jgi:hypothetical protein